MKYSVFNDEVLYTTEPITHVSKSNISFLKNMASKNARKRIRLCAHSDIEDPLHEMIIVHAKGTYVMPHRHPNKSESFHVIEGRLKVVLFKSEGDIRDVITLSDVGTGDPFYFRLSESWFHTVVPLSDIVVFHETTNGPFKHGETIFAPWAPPEDDDKARLIYLDNLTGLIKNTDTRSNRY